MKTPKNIQIQAKFISKRRISKLALTLPMILINLYWLQAKAEGQNIQAAPGTTTTVTPAGSTFNITGGDPSGNGQNLFHSFKEFGLSQNQIADFNISNSQIQNILARINGGNPSIINGLIRVSGGGTPNLFLMNPSGILFGNNARLDVPGSFTATTATGIGFGNGSFNAVGTPDYKSLTGAPTSFAFGSAQAGAIISTANLAVKSGNLTLLGGTVVSTGNLSAPNGQITLASVPGTNLVRVSQAGSVLSLDIQPSGTSSPDSGLKIATLPQLLTGISQDSATGVSVKDGKVVLTASNPNREVAAGDVAVTGNLTTQGKAIEIQAANSLAVSTNLTAEGGAIALQANGDISTRDLDSSSSTTSGGNITVTSVTGKVETGKINASFSGSSKNKSNSGDVSIKAGDVGIARPSSSIQTKSIDVTSTGGNGGKVTLNASKDIEVSYINAEGQKGGDIDIKAGGYFRATGTFTTTTNPDTNPDTKEKEKEKISAKSTKENCSSLLCSISAFSTGSGQGNEGTISISYGGAAPNTPFGVGSDYKGSNGTKGSIVTGGNNQVNSITKGTLTAPNTEVKGINFTPSGPQAPPPPP
ncbi:MAG: filamentous hemagglutinin N-terminal domain-containing protein, partial [Microcoleus sp. T1-bin1]|nr:filamentous hemagglutinin N-terminal domain-containing protein [Microcoleus sp. T1-bin1]